MQVSVEKQADGYMVRIGDKHMLLPLDSKARQTMKKGEEVTRIGSTTKYLEIDPYSNEIDLVKTPDEPSESILSEDDADDEARETIVSNLTDAWANRNNTDGGRRSRGKGKRKTRRLPKRKKAKKTRRV